MPASTLAASVIDILPETADTQTFRLSATFAYQAGQSIAVTFPGDPKKRYYSLSSSPTEKGIIAITIRADDRGKKLYDSLFGLKKGSVIEFTGPYGSMTLSEPPKGPYYFLGGGTGVTPFRSMIKYLQDVQPATDTCLIHSVRTPEDLIFKDEFLTWAKNPTFHYVPTFTRWNDPLPNAETGRIGESLLKRHGPILQGTSYLCGPKEFVTAMEHVLGKLGVPAERIRREQW